jgi:predicted nucleic acid-binding protein
MRLVDTSAWIEFLTDSAFGIELASELPDRTQWLVPTMVKLELWRSGGREKSAKIRPTDRVHRDLRRRGSRYGDRPVGGRLCARHRLATADAIVYATALAHGADLLTCDRHFEKLRVIAFQS